MSSQAQRAIGVGAVLVAVLFLALDNVVVVAVDESRAWVRFLLGGVLCVGAATAIFLFVVPWAERDSSDGNRLAQAGFVVGLLALASLIVYFAALPFVLGAGAIVLGRLGEDTAGRRAQHDPGEVSAGERATQGWAATVMGGLSFVACLVLYVILLAGG